MKLTKKQIEKFQKKILDWYSENQRDLPWRDVPLTTDGRSGAFFRDPYKILVSEVMSQQTQISRVVPKYIEWLKAFPTVEALANASTRDVLLHWSGLGYNRRALYLKKCAEILVESTQKTQKTQNTQKTQKIQSAQKIVWPTTEKELRELPGIGEYTARAILCFAFNQQVAVVDTNVRKIILTQFPISNFQFSMTEKQIEEIAEQLIPHGQAYEWNQALMDYANAELKAQKIPTQKQSKFKDSDRYFRGLIIRILLKKNTLSYEGLLENIRQHKPLEIERYARILIQLEKDKLLSKHGNIFKL